MKNKLLWLVVSSLILATAACKKKDSGEQAAEPKTPIKQIEDPVKDPADSGETPQDPGQVNLSPEQRAEMLGFAAHLPQTTEFMVSVHDGSKATRRIIASKLWRMFAGEMGIPLDEDLNDDAGEIVEEAAEDLNVGPAMMFGQEFTLAMGKGTADQLTHLMKFRSRFLYFFTSGMVRSLSQALADEEFKRFDRKFDEYMENMMFSLMLEDPEAGVGLFEKVNMPPTYLAFRTTDETRESVLQQVSSGLQMMAMAGEMVQPVQVVRGDSTFNGFQLMGAKIAEMLSEERDDMEEVMSKEMADRLIKAIGEKNLLVLSGIHKQYVVLFIGSAEEDLVFAEDIDQSLVAGDALAFCDDYRAMELLAVLYGQNAGLQHLADKVQGGLADVSAGLRDGLSGSDQLGDTRNIEALLRMVEDRESALQSLAKVHGGGTIAYFEDGLKVESYGGYDQGLVDWKTPNRFTSLGTREDVVLFANLTMNPDYDTKMRAYIEALLETAYAGALKVAELPIEDQDMVEFKNVLAIFDTKFREDLLTFWEGFGGGFSGSLGSERALVVDLKGAMPSIPGIPQPVVDSAKFPRASWLAPVADRKQLTGSWEKMNGSLTSIAASISELSGREIPMQKPLSSDKDGFTTWFYALPFTNDDCVPSVTLNDEWFAVSTSKNQAVELLQQAAAGGDMDTGFHLRLNIKMLDLYIRESLDMVLKHREALGISAADIDSFKTVSEVLSDFDRISVHVRREDGVLRSSFHFSTR